MSRYLSQRRCKILFPTTKVYLMTKRACGESYIEQWKFQDIMKLIS